VPFPREMPYDPDDWDDSSTSFPGEMPCNPAGWSDCSGAFPREMPHDLDDWDDSSTSFPGEMPCNPAGWSDCSGAFPREMPHDLDDRSDSSMPCPREQGAAAVRVVMALRLPGKCPFTARPGHDRRTGGRSVGPALARPRMGKGAARRCRGRSGRRRRVGRRAAIPGGAGEGDPLLHVWMHRGRGWSSSDTLEVWEWVLFSSPEAGRSASGSPTGVLVPCLFLLLEGCGEREWVLRDGVARVARMHWE
jgi:hypothetical protein